MMTRSNKRQIALGAMTCFLFACGGEEPGESNHNDQNSTGVVEFDDISFDSAGLQPDPLANDDWQQLPDVMPADFQSDMEMVVYDDLRLLMFEGENQDGSYFYRAPVLLDLSDEEFAVAVQVMLPRSDRFGNASHGASNGGSSGSGDFHGFTSYLYDPNGVVVDPDADFDLATNQAHIQAQVDDALADDSDILLDDDDRYLVNLTFTPTVLVWENYVDILNPTEVQSISTARQFGEDRQAQYQDDLLDLSSAGVLDVSGCTEVSRNLFGHRATYSCSADDAEFLPLVANRIVDIHFVTDTADLSDDDPDPVVNMATNSSDF